MFYYEIPVYGSEIPRHHGYLLYGAICNKVPNLHNSNNRRFWISPIIGKSAGNKIIIKNSSIKICGLAPKEAMMLRNQSASIDGNIVLFGEPTVKMFDHEPKLFSRCVILRDVFEAQQLDDVLRNNFPLANINVGKKMTVPIKGIHKIGFQVTLSNLNQNESLNLQVFGMGKMLRMGCGNFYPIK
jgi:CRISPR-associated protein Cas6